MKNALKTAAIACAMILPAMQASAVTIDFEGLAEGATLSNQYAGLGAIFSANPFSGPGTSTSGEAWATNTDMTITATDIGGLGTPSLVSGKLLHSFGGWLGEDGDPSFAINFTTSINSFSAAFAGVFAGPDVTIYAYNGATLLGTASGPATTTGQFILSFAAPTITRIAVRPGTFNDWVGVDNINYTQNAVTPAVPEPESWALMLVGFGAMGVALRGRARRVTVSYA
jgi:PEP-CTERM motif